jgi:hypothetical protein
MVFNVDFPLFYWKQTTELTVEKFITYKRVYVFGQLSKNQHYYTSSHGEDVKEGYPVQMSSHLAQDLHGEEKEIIFFAEPHLAVNLVVVPDNYHPEYYGDENLTWATDQNTPIVTFSDFLSQMYQGQLWKPNYYHRPPSYNDLPVYLNLNAWEFRENDDEDSKTPRVCDNTVYIIGTHDKGNRHNALGSVKVNAEGEKTFQGSTPAGWAMHLVLTKSDLNVLAHPHRAMKQIVIGDNQSKDMFYDFDLDDHNPDKVFFTELMNREETDEGIKFESTDKVAFSCRHIRKCFLLPWSD